MLVQFRMLTLRRTTIEKGSRCLAPKGVARQDGQAGKGRREKEGERVTRKQSRLGTYLEIEISPPPSADLEFPSRRFSLTAYSKFHVFPADVRDWVMGRDCHGRMGREGTEREGGEERNTEWQRNGRDVRGTEKFSAKYQK